MESLLQNPFQNTCPTALKLLGKTSFMKFQYSSSTFRLLMKWNTYHELNFTLQQIKRLISLSSFDENQREKRQATGVRFSSPKRSNLQTCKANSFARLTDTKKMKDNEPTEHTRIVSCYRINSLRLLATGVKILISFLSNHLYWTYCAINHWLKFTEKLFLSEGYKHKPEEQGHSGVT